MLCKSLPEKYVSASLIKIDTVVVVTEGHFYRETGSRQAQGSIYEAAQHLLQLTAPL